MLPRSDSGGMKHASIWTKPILEHKYWYSNQKIFVPVFWNSIALLIPAPKICIMGKKQCSNIVLFIYFYLIFL